MLLEREIEHANCFNKDRKKTFKINMFVLVHAARKNKHKQNVKKKELEM